MGLQLLTRGRAKGSSYGNPGITASWLEWPVTDSSVLSTGWCEVDSLTRRWLQLFVVAICWSIK